MFLFNFISALASKCLKFFNIYKEQQLQHTGKELEKSGQLERQNLMFEIHFEMRHWTFDFSVHFQLLLFQESDILL